MTFDTVDAVLLAIAFLVPGFILSSVLATTFRRRSGTASELTLQYLTFSCLKVGFWSWLIVLVVQGDWLHASPTITALLVFLILFVSPLVAGLIAIWLGRDERIQRILSSVGFRVHRFIPTAWDFKFQQETPQWVIVRLKDGSPYMDISANIHLQGMIRMNETFSLRQYSR